MFRNDHFRFGLVASLAMALIVACNPLAPRVVLVTPDRTQPGSAASPTPRSRTNTQTPPTSVPAPTPTSTVHVEASQLDGLRLLFWHPFSGERQAQLEKMAVAFSRQNDWGIQVQLKAWNGWGEMDEQVRQIPVAKEKPDLAVGYNDQVLRWDGGGYLFVDLDEYVDDPQWGLTAEERQAFYPAIWAQDYVPDGLVRGQLALGGRRLGLPWHRSGLFFFYNTTWGRELGFRTPPSSPAELLEQACTAAEANLQDADSANNGTGGWLVTSEPGLLASWIFAYGGEIARPDRTGYQFNTPEARQALDALYEFYASGCAWTGLEVDPHEAFASRQALFVVDSLVGETDIDAALEYADNQDDWLLLPFFSPSGEPVIDVSGPSLLLARTTPERQLASWLFARWLVSVENQADWAAATGYLPVSTTAVQALKTADATPALRQALPFLAYAHPEPIYASWYVLRWSLAEALDQLMIADLPAASITAILENLDRLAAEVHNQAR